MAKTYSDFSQLSKGMFRKSDPVVEVKPLPKTRASDDEALAYFGLTGRGDDGTKKWTGLVESPTVLLKLSPVRFAKNML